MRTFLFALCALSFVLTSCTLTPDNQGQSNSSNPPVLIDAPTYGSGKHVLEYYGDYQCPACIKFAKTILPVFEEFAASGQLTIVYKQFPLTTIHKNAYRDALAALCAAEQGEYISYKKALYALEDTKRGASVSDSDRVDLAKEISAINSDTFAQCLKSDKYASSVDRDIADGDKKRVSGTPTIFLDGLRLDMGLFSDVNSLRMKLADILSK